MPQTYEIISDPAYACRVATLNARFADAKEIDLALQSVFLRCSLSFIEMHAKGERAVPVPKQGISDLLPANKWTSVTFKVARSPDIEFWLQWSAPDEFEVLKPAHRVILIVTFEAGRDWPYVERLFLSIVDAFSPHWGELLECHAAGKWTNAPLGAHDDFCPQLGSANFFGPDYCDFLGGIEAIRRAGFARVEEMAGGVYVVLPEAKTPEEFERIRAEVQSRLGRPETFSRKRGGPVPWFREWGPKPETHPWSSSWDAPLEEPKPSTEPLGIEMKEDQSHREIWQVQWEDHDLCIEASWGYRATKFSGRPIQRATFWLKVDGQCDEAVQFNEAVIFTDPAQGRMRLEYYKKRGRTKLTSAAEVELAVEGLMRRCKVKIMIGDQCLLEEERTIDLRNG